MRKFEGFNDKEGFQRYITTFECCVDKNKIKAHWGVVSKQVLVNGCLHEKSYRKSRQDNHENSAK